MSEFGSEVVKSARTRIEAPFRHHFKPLNLCESGGRTVDECMNRGMDIEGHDCSGLAIASICEVLAIETARWPRNLRHTRQLSRLATDEDFGPGDLRLYYSFKNRIHLGIATTAIEVVHASGLTNRVEESAVTNLDGSFAAVRTIAAKSIEMLLASQPERMSLDTE